MSATDDYLRSVDGQAHQSDVEIIERLEEENARLRTVLRQVLNPSTCCILHHDAKDRHDYDEPCPVVARFRALSEGGGE